METAIINNKKKDSLKKENFLLLLLTQVLLSLQTLHQILIQVKRNRFFLVQTTQLIHFKTVFRTGFSIKEMLMIGVGTVIFGGICKTLYSFLPKEEIIYSKRERPILLISPKMESLLFNSGSSILIFFSN